MNFLGTVEADAETVINDVKAGLTYLKTEATAVIAWVDQEDPGAQVAMANFVQEADQAASELTTLGATGLQNAIAAGSQDIETFLANLIQSSGLAKGAQGATPGTPAPAGSVLDALDVAGVSTLETIATNLVKTGLVDILAKLAPAVAAAV